MFSRILQSLLRAGARLWPMLLLGVPPAMGQPVATSEPVEALLPPERDGEWLRDQLDDASLWFASSDNLAFEPVAPELSGYEGRRWVGVVDGRPAWVAYYLPGDIRSFEVDTHHLGAFATDFRFFAGSDFRALAPVEVETELVEFEARWLRLYHAKVDLPPGTRFILIQFPDDLEREMARLTEVWLQCDLREFNQTAPPRSVDASVDRLESVPPAAPMPATAPVTEALPPAAIVVPKETPVEAVQPFVVYEFRFPVRTIAKLEPVVDLVADVPPTHVESPTVDEFDVSSLAAAVAQVLSTSVQAPEEPAQAEVQATEEQSVAPPLRRRGPRSKL